MSGRNTKSAQVKVKRYRAGQVPEGVTLDEDYYSTSDEEIQKEVIQVEDKKPYSQIPINAIKLSDQNQVKAAQISISNLNINERKDIASRYAQSNTFFFYSFI